jgi:hypothetical protein
MPARLVERARIVLLAADGLENKQIAQRMNMTPEKGVALAEPLPGMRHRGSGKGRPAAGAPAHHHRTEGEESGGNDAAQQADQRHALVDAHHGAAVGISEASVRRIWRAHGLKPNHVRIFKLSRDPRFQEKLEDIVGLYLNPPEHAVVLCADEKSQI